MNILIAPPWVNKLVELDSMDVAWASIVITVDGRTLKNRFAPPATTDVRWGKAGRNA